VGLGVIAAEAKRITDTMFMAAAKALAELSPAAKGKEQRLLPHVNELRKVSTHVAVAVAKQAMADGVAEKTGDNVLMERIRQTVWEPESQPYELTSDKKSAMG